MMSTKRNISDDTSNGRGLALMAIGAIICVVIWLLWRSATPRPTEFPFSVPEGVKILHSFRHVGGGNDKTYAFVFEDVDQGLINQLITDWNLVDESSSHFPGAFASMIAKSWEIAWWPDRDTLEAMPVRYVFIDNATQIYKKVYCDDGANLLYVEYGNW